MFQQHFRQSSIVVFFTTAVMIAIFFPQFAVAEIAVRPGWVVMPTGHDYLTLTQRVADVARRYQVSVVNVASASVGAEKGLDQKIPGNMVIGLYHPRYAVRMLDVSIASGIEAPIRVYVTENADGSATISYKKPSFSFAPYMDEGGDKLKDLADELDLLFASLVKDAAAK